MQEHNETPQWNPEQLKFRPLRLVTAWLITAAALGVTAAILPGIAVVERGGALVVALVIGVLNAILPPLFAALRLPFTLVFGFLITLLLNALIMWIAAGLLPSFQVDSFWWALIATVVVAAVAIVLQVLFSTNDDDAYTIRVVQRIARRQGDAIHTTSPGLVFLEIDGLALPVLRRAMRDGSAPNMARWLAEGKYRLMEWEPDLSSQTGSCQAGILLGSNFDIPAFRWVEKENLKMVTCSAPPDCAQIELQHSTGIGLLADGGASRGNLFSGDAEDVILTVSRMEAEKKSNPGYRAFFANGFNVSRALSLFVWELILEWTASIRAARRDVQPRGHRGGSYPFLRAAMCVVVRDLIVYGVLSDMMRGRPAIYASLSSYDEVAHHSGLERADTLEALRKLDQQIGRIDRARRYAPRPYEVVVLSDHGQTQGATFKQRNGYGLDQFVERLLGLSAGETAYATGDEQNDMVGLAFDEATGQTGKDRPAKRAKNDISGKRVVVLGSGNLGLIYLMDEQRRLTREEIDERYPRLIPELRSHPHVGWLLVRSATQGAVVLGPRGERYLDEGRLEGEDPLAGLPANAPRHLLRTDSFPHVADLMVGSFYDPELDEGCAFEELICFHGGLGGAQTRPFILAPRSLPAPDGPIVGAESVHDVLVGWRSFLHGYGQPKTDSKEPVVPPPVLTSSMPVDGSSEMTGTT